MTDRETIFNYRMKQTMESDYRDFAEVSEEDARNAVSAAREFIAAIKALTEYVSNKV